MSFTTFSRFIDYNKLYEKLLQKQDHYCTLQFIPDYDREIEAEFDVQSEREDNLHIDKTVISALMNLEISFLFRPLLNPLFIASVSHLMKYPPNFILMGIIINRKN